MAMCTTIVSIRQKNIRHLYYGQPSDMFYRTSADYPNLDQLRIAKSDKELREGVLKSAKQNYSPSELEPAPAFKCVSAAEAEEIGKRLYAGHRPNRNNGSNSSGGKATGQGRTTANKNGNQSVKFKPESQQQQQQEDATSPTQREGSTASSPTQPK